MFIYISHPRFGCMHLMATNLSMWIHIVIKESILEIGHIEHEEDSSRKVNQIEFLIRDKLKI